MSCPFAGAAGVRPPPMQQPPAGAGCPMAAALAAQHDGTGAWHAWSAHRQHHGVGRLRTPRTPPCTHALAPCWLPLSRPAAAARTHARTPLPQHHQWQPVRWALAPPGAPSSPSCTAQSAARCSSTRSACAGAATRFASHASARRATALCAAQTWTPWRPTQSWRVRVFVCACVCVCL
jgi:hypothetical protein